MLALPFAILLLCGGPLRADPSQEASPGPVTQENDGRRTGGRLLSNFGRNTVGLFSLDNLKPFLAGAAATGVATPFDDNVQRYFGETRRAKWLGDAVDVEGQPRVVVPMALILFGAGRLSSHQHQRFRDMTYDIAQATLVEAVYSTTLKYATERLRPDGSDHLSFPSGHTANAFAWATVAARHFGPKVGVPAYVFAALVGVGRMEKNAHYLSDVVAGATLGYLVGRTVTRRDAEPLPRERRVRVEPSVPRGGGLGIKASVEF